MTRHAHTGFGNRIAPLRFILFLFILIVASIGFVFVLGTSSWARAIMAGFDIAAGVFLLSIIPLLLDGDSASIRRHAAENDANRGMLLALTTALSVVVLVTVGDELFYNGRPWAPLVIITLGLAWAFANMVYTLHYAHYFYSGRNDEQGLSFPGTDCPDYWDFVYFAFTLGMTFQTSDVTVNSRSIRRIVLVHSLASFVFNIGILAFSINTLGGK